MAQFNIHWKGRPHFHLPRIRVASPNYNAVRRRRYAHKAAEEALQLPFSLALKKARLQQRTRAHRGGRSSRGLLEGIITRRQTAQSAEPVIQKLRSKGTGGDLASKEQENRKLEPPQLTNQFSACNLRPSSGLHNSGNSPPLLTEALDNPTSSTSTPELDQAVDIELARRKHIQGGVVSGSINSDPNEDMITDNFRRKSSHNSAQALNISQTCDSRLPIRGVRRRTNSTPSQHGLIDQRLRSSRVLMADKQQTPQNHSTEQPISGSISGFKSIDTVSSPISLAGQLSRTPSQLVTLKHFSRELELHLVAQEAARHACLRISSPSPSPSTLSANTIVEFIPYLDEFQAAGLAVTSTEQRRSFNRESGGVSIPLHPKTVRDNLRTPPKASDYIGNGQATASTDRSNISLQTSTTSSQTTMITFSTPAVPNSDVVYPTQNIATTKALPWLRKAQELSTLSQSVPADRVKANSERTSSSSSTCKTCATTIVDFSPLSIGSGSKLNETNPSPIRCRLPNVNYAEMGGRSITAKSQETGQPSEPETPLPGVARPQNDGMNSGSGTRNKTISLVQCPIPGQRTITIPASINTRKKGKSRLLSDGALQKGREIFLIEPNPTFSTPTRTLRGSPKHLAKETTSNGEGPESMDVLINSSGLRSPLRPSCSSPSPRSRCTSLNSKLTYESSNASISSPYGFETPPIFERALDVVKNDSHSSRTQIQNEGRVVTNVAALPLLPRGNSDPVKRKSASSTPSAPSAPSAPSSPSLGFTATSNTRTITSTDQLTIRDKDVYKGLQIALAAVCDTSVDSWITETSGYQVRRFLADLRALERLGVNNFVDEPMRTVQKRKEYNRRRMYHEHVHVRNCGRMFAEEEPEGREQKIGGRTIASDGIQRKLLVAEMLSKRQAGVGKSIEERALGMGWRNRSVSAG